MPECKFYKEWNEIAMDPKETLINISSTLHEVYSYGTEASVAEFWERVFGSGFKYIAIRDMMVSETTMGLAEPSQRCGGSFYVIGNCAISFVKRREF